MKRVLTLMHRHGSLLLCSLALSVALAAVNDYETRAVAGVDPRALLRDLNPNNLLGREKTEKSSTTNKKGDTSGTKTSPGQTSSSSPSSQPSAGVSAPVQESVSDLAPLPTVDTAPLPHLYPNIPHGFLVKSSAPVSGVTVRGSNAPVLAASPQGWKLAGLSWYWWLIVLVPVALIGRWGLRRFGDRQALASHKA